MTKAICHHQKVTPPPLKGYRATTKRSRALGRKLHLFSSYRASRGGTPEVVPPTVGICPSSDTTGHGECLRQTPAIFAFRCSPFMQKGSREVRRISGKRSTTMYCKQKTYGKYSIMHPLFDANIQPVAVYNIGNVKARCSIIGHFTTRR